MATPKDLPRDIGGFIRDLRKNAQISLRQLAEQAGVSNPYLSQIERGLRKPSAEVLQQLATALRVSTPAMYLRAGLLDDKEGQGVLAAIAVDPGLTMAQKQSLTQIYETFRRENDRLAETGTETGTGTGTGTDNETGAGAEAPQAGPDDSVTVASAAATGDAVTSVTTTETSATPAPAAKPARKRRTSADRAATAAEEENQS